MTQRAIARECADWIGRKATFRSNATKSPMQQFAVVDDNVWYQPLQGFTAADLGYEQGASVSNMVTKADDPADARTYMQSVRPDMEQPRPARRRHRRRPRPHRRRLRRELAAAHLLPDPLQPVLRVPEDISEDVLPNDLTGYQDT